MPLQNPGVIDEVRRNMELPEALRFRSNTGNRAYGFEQTVHKEIPEHATPNKGGSEATNYKFAVAGNLRNIRK